MIGSDLRRKPLQRNGRAHYNTTSIIFEDIFLFLPNKFYSSRLMAIRVIYQAFIRNGGAWKAKFDILSLESGENCSVFAL